METQISIGDVVVSVGADGKPERLVEVRGVISRAEGQTYEVGVPGAKRSRTVTRAELLRLVPA